MDPISVSEIERYLEAMDDRSLVTLDQVATFLQIDPERARLIHDALFRIFERMSNRDIHKKAWATVDNLMSANRLISIYDREVQALQRLQEETAVNEEREQSAFKAKELATALNSTIQTVQKLAQQMEEVHSSYQEREAAGTIIRCVFDVLRQVDPIIAVRCRQNILDKFEALALVVPGG